MNDPSPQMIVPWLPARFRQPVQPELISIRTLSQLIDTPEKTIRHWIYKRYRDIPFIKIGHQIRFPVKAIRPWAGLDPAMVRDGLAPAAGLSDGMKPK